MARYKKSRIWERYTANPDDIDKFGLFFTVDNFRSIVNKKYLFSETTPSEQENRYNVDFLTFKKDIEQKINDLVSQIDKKKKPDYFAIVIEGVDLKTNRPFKIGSSFRDSLNSVFDELRLNLNRDKFYEHIKPKYPFPFLIIHTWITLSYKRKSTKKEKLISANRFKEQYLQTTIQNIEFQLNKEKSKIEKNLKAKKLSKKEANKEISKAEDYSIKLLRKISRDFKTYVQPKIKNRTKTRK